MCLCHPEGKGCKFLSPFAIWSSLQADAEKIIHQVRDCIEEHWMDEDFVCFQDEHEECF